MRMIVSINLCCRDNAGFIEYLTTTAFRGSNETIVDPVAAKYPMDPAAGAPFCTGTANAGTPIYKRLAAFQTDYGFQAARRFFLRNRVSKSPGFAYCESYHLLIILSQ